MNRLDLPSYDWLSHNWLARWVNNRAFARHTDVLRGRVVDMGCGTAPYKRAALAMSAVTEYVGVDWEQSLHDRSQVDIVADLCTPLPIENGWATTVVSFQVMEHLPDPASFLAECFRVLEPGGRLLVTVPFMWHVHEAPHDYQRFTEFGLRRALEEAGFQRIEVEANTGFFATWFLKLNYQLVRLLRGPAWCRKIGSWLLAPAFLFFQVLALLLECLPRDETETASYTATAAKPGTGI